jgi:tricorn protease
MKHKFKLLLLLAFLFVFGKAQVFAYDDARMLRYPDIKGEQIVFVYAGNIWTVEASGGEARQLTSHKGLELFPKISPDGKWIAFSAEYSGSRQVYIMPAQGGTPQQLTYYNDVGNMPPRGGFDNVVMGWTPDSKQVFFRSNRTPFGERMGKYFTVSINGGLEKELPIPHGGFADLSPDGKKVAFTYVDREFRTWKRYKGGRASDLWIYNLEEDISEKITEFDGTDQIPVWQGDKIYFASDRDLWLNIYSYDTKSGNIQQITTHDTFDVMWPSGAEGKIVYEHGGYIYKLDTETGNYEKVNVSIRYDNPNTLPYFKNVEKNIHSYTLSPSGKRVLFDARGDIFSVPAGEGSTYNLTQKQGVRAVFPQWSPDGKKIAFYSDESGEYEVYLLENKKGAKAKQITRNSKGWKYKAEWSPDSKLLVFFDRSMRLQLLDTETEKITIIDIPTSDEIRSYAFSPDSRFITYTKSSANGQSSVWVYNIENKKTQQLTGDEFYDYSPVFSKCGNYLFFLSNRDFNLEFSNFEFNYLYNKATRIYAMALNDEAPRLFEPNEIIETLGKNEDKSDKAENTDVQINIDFENAENRVVAFPFPSGSYRGLDAAENGIIYINDKGLQYYNIQEHENKTIMENISRAELSADGKKFLYRYGSGYGVADFKPGQKAGEGKLNLDDLTMKIEPRKEWTQIFNDAWRIYRDYFYVSNLHNVDWQGFKEKYSTMLPYLNHRFDLDYILGELVAETNTGHAYVNYGDFERVKRTETGLLGAKFKADSKNNRYIISKIYEGENWNKSRRSPLTMQGIDISEGEYLIAVDGHEITTEDNPYRFLENKARRKVDITVNNKPSSNGARSYMVEPIKSELELMYLDWVNTRRELTEKLSNGRIGYIHVPNTAVEGNRELHRGMYANHHKDALIIDERFNGGGFIPDRMIELLSRETMALWHRAGLDPMRTPGIAHDGPKAMLINGYSSSGGDAFPYFFRQKDLGVIIGTRTWGGLVGMSGNAGLVDGGYIAVPRFGIYEPDGKWIIEGIGVSPDIKIQDMPHLLAKGKDPSLEKAIEVLLKELDENPPKQEKVPENPNRSQWLEHE